MKRLVKALPLLMAILVTVALAIPLIEVSVQQLGAGFSEVVPPVNKAWVRHVFKVVNGRIVLDGVKVKFDKNLPAGTFIRIELRDSDDNVLASGEVTLDSELPAGQWLFIDTDDLEVNEIVEYDRVVVVVAGYEVST